MVICGGPGGVGKTTCSAAIATGMASLGLKVAVVTIDPARRLADALGLEQLGNEPRQVDPERFTGHGIDMQGELWALMLDSKRTFDSLIERVSPNEKARDDVLNNRIYQELSTAVAGSQEFTAISKLYELDSEGDFDLLVLDTPPSRNALDFLDAPDRLTGFLQGRAIRMFLRPAAGIGGRVLGAGTGVVFGLMRRVTGVDLLDDLSTFFRALSGMIDDIAERGRHVKALLSDPKTTFLLVTSPERDPIEETIYFHRRLREQKLPFGGLVINRAREELPAEEDLAEELADELGDDLARRVATTAAELAALSVRDTANLGHLRRTLKNVPEVRVPQLPGDVHDVEGLAHVCAHLFGDAVVVLD